MVVIKKGITKSNPNSKKHLTGESLMLKQRYKKQSIELQEKKLDLEFFKGFYTMKTVSLKLNIDRANICRYIGKRKKENRIFLVCFGICPITKSTGVGFYTSNYDLYLQFKAGKNGK